MKATKEQQLEALQNWATKLNLKIHVVFQEDQRKKIPMFFAVSERTGHIISPSKLTYDQMNHFLCGWNNCLYRN